MTQVFPGSPAALADIRPGEVIVTIDGVPTAGKPVNASVARIVGPAGTKVRLQLRRTGVAGLIDLTLTRRKISPPLTTSRLIDDHGTKVGYVSLSAFAQGAGAQVGRAVAGLQKRGAQRLVFDLRDNGGGLVDEAVKVAGDFLPAGKVVVTTQGLHAAKEVLKTSGGNPDRSAARRPRQRQHGERLRDRHRRAAGLPARHGHRHEDLRQGRRADRAAAARAERASRSRSPPTSRRSAATSTTRASSPRSWSRRSHTAAPIRRWRAPCASSPPDDSGRREGSAGARPAELSGASAPHGAGNLTAVRRDALTRACRGRAQAKRRRDGPLS